MNGPALRRVPVERGGDQLLAGAALADDQDRSVVRGGQADRLEYLTHRGALADQFGLLVVASGASSDSSSRSRRALTSKAGHVASGPLQGQQDFVQVERLTQIVVAPRLMASMAAAEPPSAVTTITGKSASSGPSWRAPPVHLDRASSGPAARRRVSRRESGPAPHYHGCLQRMVAFGLEQHEVAADRPVIVGDKNLRTAMGSSIRRRGPARQGEERARAVGPDRHEARRGGPARSRGRWPDPVRCPSALVVKKGSKRWHHLGRKTRTGVRDARQDGAGRVLPRRQAERAARRHGLDGVGCQVAEDLEQGRGAMATGGRSVEIDLDADAFDSGGPAPAGRPRRPRR